ncbi:hypothetical protein TNCV_413181 [Trichonephila clavipes]|nr:hypothetical protein TNCV_413181 [Trichonephila clavipes]
MEYHSELVEALGNNALPYRTVARNTRAIGDGPCNFKPWSNKWTSSEPQHLIVQALITRKRQMSHGRFNVHQHLYTAGLQW